MVYVLHPVWVVSGVRRPGLGSRQVTAGHRRSCAGTVVLSAHTAVRGSCARENGGSDPFSTC